MDWKGALRARLVAAAPIDALIWHDPTSNAPAIYWVDRPQASELPAITLQTIDDARPRVYGGLQSARQSVVQVDVWATTFAAKEALAEAVIAELSTAETSNGIKFLAAETEVVTDLGERVETQFIHRTRIDFLIWHSVP
jgi:hypothetical protein